MDSRDYVLTRPSRDDGVNEGPLPLLYNRQIHKHVENSIEGINSGGKHTENTNSTQIKREVNEVKDPFAVNNGKKTTIVGPPLPLEYMNKTQAIEKPKVIVNLGKPLPLPYKQPRTDVENVHPESQGATNDASSAADAVEEAVNRNQKPLDLSVHGVLRRIKYDFGAPLPLEYIVEKGHTKLQGNDSDDKIYSKDVKDVTSHRFQGCDSSFEEKIEENDEQVKKLEKEVENENEETVEEKKGEERKQEEVETTEIEEEETVQSSDSELDMEIQKYIIQFDEKSVKERLSYDAEFKLKVIRQYEFLKKVLGYVKDQKVELQPKGTEWSILKPSLVAITMFVLLCTISYFLAD